MIAAAALSASMETTITLIMGAGALATAAGAIVKARRTSSWLPLCLLLGSIFTFFFESVPISLGHVAYPAPRLYPGFVTLNRSLPLFVLLSYIGYWTGGITFLIDRLSAPVRAAEWMRLYLIFVVAFTLFEMIFTYFGFWTYYGRQPLMVLGMPLAWGFINMHGLFTGAIALAFLRHVLPLWTLPFLMPCLLIGSQTIAGLPMYLALNSTQNLGLLTLGAFGSIIVPLLLLLAQGRLLATRAAPA